MFELIEFIKIIILSIVQGITEWLPISSTGHMLLINEINPLQLEPRFVDLFMIWVQLGSIFAVVLLYFKKLNPFALSKTPKERHDTWILWSKVILGSLPTFVIGLALDDYMDSHFHSPFIIAATLIIYGLVFLWIESSQPSKHSRQIKSLSELRYVDAVLIGLFQSLALIPGTSRSGATIVGALLIGTSRFVATEFSFFMGIIAMFGASGIKLIKYVRDFGLDFSTAELIYLISGMTIAFVVSIVVIKFLINYIKHNNFKSFGYYRILLGSIVFAYFFLYK